jgi:hypothetical protein
MTCADKALCSVIRGIKSRTAAQRMCRSNSLCVMASALCEVLASRPMVWNMCGNFDTHIYVPDEKHRNSCLCQNVGFTDLK